jgi:hypothetical protein
MDDIRDATNITGISGILNDGGAGINLKDIESSIINDNDETPKVNDITEYKKQLEKLGGALGVDFNEESDEESGDETNENIMNTLYQRVTPMQNTANFASTYNSGEISGMYDNIRYKPKTGSYGERITEDQKKQKILSHVLAGVEDQKFSVEKEKREDDKAILLEQIDVLYTNLKDEGVDVSRVPEVDMHSPTSDIENVHRTLRLKNDRTMYRSFAEECILAGANVLEWTCDGKKDYFGKRPDLTGWSATVMIKLRRMRYDTSTFVSGIMHDFNLGPGYRIMLELVPSLFLYSKMRKNQSSDNLITSDEMNAAIDRIRDIEETSDDK